MVSLPVTSIVYQTEMDTVQIITIGESIYLDSILSVWLTCRVSYLDGLWNITCQQLHENTKDYATWCADVWSVTHPRPGTTLDKLFFFGWLCLLLLWISRNYEWNKWRLWDRKSGRQLSYLCGIVTSVERRNGLNRWDMSYSRSHWRHFNLIFGFCVEFGHVLSVLSISLCDGSDPVIGHTACRTWVVANWVVMFDT